MTAPVSPLVLDLPNCGSPGNGLCTGGQPPADQLREAQRRGFRTVINLRPQSEQTDFDEAAFVASLGLRYIHIPISGPGDLTSDNARKLANALGEAGDGATLIHCLSGNRVGALFALKARFLDGLDVEAALAVGRSAGLKAMEPVVRQILSA